MRAVIDSNILIDFLHGAPQAEAELKLYESPAISQISWIEVMVGTPREKEAAARGFLRTFEVLPLNESIAERAVHLRQTERLKLPDAVIWATAQVHQCLLVTRNSRDFGGNNPGVRVPYQL